jgi:hypothetical protein
MALPARNRNGADDGPRELHATPKEYRDLIPIGGPTITGL